VEGLPNFGPFSISVTNVERAERLAVTLSAGLDGMVRLFFVLLSVLLKV
jgi:hypothetical protein